MTLFGSILRHSTSHFPKDPPYHYKITFYRMFPKNHQKRRPKRGPGGGRYEWLIGLKGLVQRHAKVGGQPAGCPPHLSFSALASLKLPLTSLDFTPIKTPTIRSCRKKFEVIWITSGDSRSREPRIGSAESFETVPKLIKNWIWRQT